MLATASLALGVLAVCSVVFSCVGLILFTFIGWGVGWVALASGAAARYRGAWNTEASRRQAQIGLWLAGAAIVAPLVALIVFVAWIVIAVSQSG
jgi:hypothetical protein